jgi:hypothetical protein
MVEELVQQTSEQAEEIEEMVVKDKDTEVLTVLLHREVLQTRLKATCGVMNNIVSNLA